MFWPLPEKFPAAERKNRTPELIEKDRHHRCFRMTCDHFESALQTRQRAGTRELAFRENANDLTDFNLIGCSANCLARFTPINRDGAHHSQHGLECRFVIKFLVDDKANRPRTGWLENDRINPGDVSGSE